MSEHLFKFLLSEIKIVRLRCKSPFCESVVEVSSDKFSAIAARGLCPVCGIQLIPSGDEAMANMLKSLGHVLAKATWHRERCDIEFAIPSK